MKVGDHFQILFCAMLLTAIGCGTQRVELHSVHGQTVEHWINELKQQNPKARIAAIGALQSVGAADPAAVPAIIGQLSDPDASVRDAAVLALLNIGPAAKDATEALSKAKSDPDATVRAHAEAALRRIAPGS